MAFSGGVYTVAHVPQSRNAVQNIPNHPLVHKPFFRELESVEGQAKAILVPCFKLNLRLLYLLGILIICAQIAMSILIILSAQTYTFSNQTSTSESTDSSSTTTGTSVDHSDSTPPITSTLTTVSVMQQYTAVRYFPGVVAGMAIIAFAAFAQTVANRVQTEFHKERNKPENPDPHDRRVSMAGHIHIQSVDAKSSVNFKDNSYTTWSGLPLSRVLLVILSAQAIIFLLAFLACTIVGLMESTTVLQSLPKDSVYGLVLGIVALQAFSIAPFGVLALFLTIQIITTTSLFGYLCCAGCYPVPVYVDWEKQCAATKPLVIYRGDELLE